MKHNIPTILQDHYSSQLLSLTYIEDEKNNVSFLKQNVKELVGNFQNFSHAKDMQESRSPRKYKNVALKEFPNLLSVPQHLELMNIFKNYQGDRKVIKNIYERLVRQLWE